MNYERHPQSPQNIGGSAGLPFPKRYRMSWLTGGWSGPMAGMNNAQWLTYSTSAITWEHFTGEHWQRWIGGAGTYGVFGGAALQVEIHKYYHTATQRWHQGIRIRDLGFTGHQAWTRYVMLPTDQGNRTISLFWVNVVGFSRTWMPQSTQYRPALWTEFPPT